MLAKNYNFHKKLVSKLLKQPVTAQRGSLDIVVRETLKQKNKILKLAKSKATPFYLFDQKSLDKSLSEFVSPFRKSLPGFKAYYAVKSNPYDGILKSAMKHGLGLDVSSRREMALALKCGAKDMIFSGPGKTEADLTMAIKNRAKVIVQMDSFGELERLGELAKKNKVKIRAGVRIFTKFHGPWTKFGIDLKELAKFWRLAQKYPQIQLQGIQCHMSWNESAEPFAKLIKEIADYLRREFNADLRAQIKFIDLGGGFWPRQADGFYPWDLPQGEVLQKASEYFDEKIQYSDKYFISEAATLKEYAEGISSAIAKYFRPILNCNYFFEPGRIISTRAMHLVFRVVDIKTKDKVILDGGINMIGWESYLYNYLPVVNLTHPSLQEKKITLFGCLCAPDDILGYYCYTGKIQAGDILIMPNQGAYTYTFAQNFIKPIPPVFKLV